MSKIDDVRKIDCLNKTNRVNKKKSAVLWRISNSKGFQEVKSLSVCGDQVTVDGKTHTFTHQ